MTGMVTLGRLGFDIPKLRFALQTACAACAALLVAWLLGLEHPQWSAMTVWAASQPTRGQLLEKSLFRVAGTLSGTMAGIALVLLSQGNILPLVCGLSIWIALCAGIGNVQRGFVSYGTILAGYSASMVSLLDSGHPNHVLALGGDRLATILVGVGLALAVGLLFSPRLAEEELTGRLRRLTVRVLRDLQSALGRESRRSDAARQHDILNEIAALEEGLEPHGAGSLRSRQTVHTVRSLLTVEVSLLMLARRAGMAETEAAVHAPLDDAIVALESGASHADALTALDLAARAAPHGGSLQTSLAALALALGNHFNSGKGYRPGPHPDYPVILHKNWVEARWAMIRAGGAMLAVGLLWVLTGWSALAFLLLGVSIMTSIFSTFENPGRMMRFVFIGQLYGVAGALACRFLAWPLADSEIEVVLLTMPFILAGALFFSHARTMAAAFDYAMVSLLLLHPVYPLPGNFPTMLGSGAAVVTAPLIAMFTYRFVFPLDARKRFDIIAAAMVRELQDMARRPDALEHRPVWRARLYHRLLRLTRLAERGGKDQFAATEGGLAVLAVGSAILAMKQALATGNVGSRPVLRSLEIALARSARLASAPAKAAQALERAASLLAPLQKERAETIAEAARELADNLAFFGQRQSAG